MSKKRRRRRMLDRHYAEIVHGVLDKGLNPLDQSEPICVDITNVARWVYGEGSRESWIINEDLPCIAPPWPWAWFEYDVSDIVDDLMYDTMGYMFIAEEVPEELCKRESVGVRWYGLLEVWIQFRKRVKFAGNWWLPIMEDGRLVIEDTELRHHRLISGDAFRSNLIPLFFALSLLNCPTVYWQDLPAAPRFARKARKQKGRGDVVYMTLVIDPLRKQARREAQEEGGTGKSITQALHIVRGHFKDYRDGPGLFGKYPGLYWWNMHTRGDAEFGEIDKDYEVRPPKGGDDSGDGLG